MNFLYLALLRQINSRRAWSLHISIYNYVGKKNAQNLPKRQGQISAIKWYELVLIKVHRKEQFLLAGMTVGNNKRGLDFWFSLKEGLDF